MTEATATRVGILCGQAGDGALAERAARYGVADVLARVVAGAAAGSVSGADLDALDDAFARHGIDELTVRRRGFQPWRGARGVTVTAWVCPTAACTRAIAATVGDPPMCGLTTARLREIELRP